MKVTVTLEFPSEEAAVDYLDDASESARKERQKDREAAFEAAKTAKNAAAASPVPTGDPVPQPGAPRPGPQPVPAPHPAPAPLPTPSPMPPPAPTSTSNGGGNVTVQQVMGAMQEYAKIHKAAGIKNVLSHVGISKITEANPEQLLWLKGVFDLNQPMAAAS